MVVSVTTLNMACMVVTRSLPQQQTGDWWRGQLRQTSVRPFGCMDVARCEQVEPALGLATPVALFPLLPAQEVLHVHLGHVQDTLVAVGLSLGVRVRSNVHLTQLAVVLPEGQPHCEHTAAPHRGFGRGMRCTSCIPAHARGQSSRLLQQARSHTRPAHRRQYPCPLTPGRVQALGQGLGACRVVRSGEFALQRNERIGAACSLPLFKPLVVASHDRTSKVEVVSWH